MENNSFTFQPKDLLSNKREQNNLSRIKNNNIESFKVYIRIRPYTQKDLNIFRNSNISLNNGYNNNNNSKALISPKDLPKNNNISEKDKIQMIKIDKNILYLEDVKNHKNNKIFTFDNIFPETANNDNIFNDAIKPMIDKIMNGYNSTALAYGVTGTGKTYTIFGDLTSNISEEGIIFKACDYLFEKIEMNKKDVNNNNANNNVNYCIKVCYFEIYDEIVKDLINENATPLMIVEDAQKGVMCPNAKELIINDSVELKKIINESNKRRTMATTNQNQFSSRSHAILQMTLEKKIQKNNLDYEISNSKFLVVDLAGSEKSSEKGKRREEGVNINKSLFTLSNCLNILSEKSNTGKFVPYRDSKLTRLLKDSLGGNILTVMLACISSLSYNYDETLSTLNYAYKAKKITKKVMKNIKEININNIQYKEMIDSLKNEIIQLKNIIKTQEIKLKERKQTNTVVTENNNDKNKTNNNLIINTNNVINESQDVKNTRHCNDMGMDEVNISQQYKNGDLEPNVECSNIDINSKINVEIYNKYIEELSYGNLDINNLKNIIESLKNDKNILENILLKDNIKNDNITNKYNSLKIIYNKFIEILNEKLIENIEQNMIYNFNIKEISELNKMNSDKIIELEKEGKEEEKIIEEINYTKKNIEENNIQKNQIYESIKKNEEQKDELKKVLLILLNNKTDSIDQFIHILKEKDKLFKITKQYEKEIENYVKLQKQKDEDINKINRKIEILRAKLKEKDKKINELEKKGGKTKLEIKNSRSNTNNNNDGSKLKLNDNKNNKTENEKNKNQMINYNFNGFMKACLKRKDSKKNKGEIKEIFSPSSTKNAFRKTLNQKKFSYSQINNEKNHVFKNNTKRLSTIQNKVNNINYDNIVVKRSKKTKKNQKRNYKLDNNDENLNNTNINDYYEMKKYKDLTIPKTTITLAELDHHKKLNKSIYLNDYNSTNNENKKKITMNNNSKINKKYSSNIFKQNMIKKTNISEYSDKNTGKNLIKSITVDLKRNNYSPELIIKTQSNNKTSYTNNTFKTNKTDKGIKNKNKYNSNLLAVKPYTSEKLSIDLNNLKDPLNIQNDLNENINKIRLSKKNNNYITKNVNSLNRNLKNINIKISKPNPKLLKEIQINKKMIKKLSLQEARYENKLKGDKNNNEKNELNLAQDFINKYDQMKSNEPIECDNYFLNKINHSTTSLIKKNKILDENANKISNETLKIKINKIYIGINELKSDNNIDIMNNKKD